MERVPFIGINRHRIGIDGIGVTTLACFHGCTLRCRYCLNRRCLGPDEGMQHLTPKELYDFCSIDNLYFVATGGGVCFGGGEPLLRMDFIEEFRQLCEHNWHLTAETALSVPRDAVERAAETIDDFIIDIKDCNDDIYQRYTGRSNTLSMGNLRWLVDTVGPDRITVRVPLIPNYNTSEDTDRSVEILKAMGITHFDRFEYTLRKMKEENSSSTP